MQLSIYTGWSISGRDFARTQLGAFEHKNSQNENEKKIRRTKDKKAHLRQTFIPSFYKKGIDDIDKSVLETEIWDCSYFGLTSSLQRSL